MFGLIVVDVKLAEQWARKMRNFSGVKLDNFTWIVGSDDPNTRNLIDWQVCDYYFN